MYIFDWVEGGRGVKFPFRLLTVLQRCRNHNKLQHVMNSCLMTKGYKPKMLGNHPEIQTCAPKHLNL